MQIRFNREQGLAIGFDKTEFLFAYYVLKWLDKYFTKSPEIELIVKQLEEELKPKPKLALVVDTKICEKCARLINLRKEEFVVVENEGTYSYVHHCCPPTDYKEVK